MMATKRTKQAASNGDGIEWADPPPPHRGAGCRAHDPRRDAMDAAPGKWLVWSRRTSVSSGSYGYLRRQGYEAVQRREGGGTTIYARRPPGWTP